MLDRLTNEDIRRALDELVASLGAKEEVSFDDLLALVRRKDACGCVQQIAARLGLPVRIDLSYVPRDFTADTAERFTSTSLAPTDQAGRGKAGIAAQVAVPQYLPMFGTRELQGYPIRVRVSEDCNEHPETFVALIAHELSHVLLASLRHPAAHSELHADLAPVILGFGEIVARGRKVVKKERTSGWETTWTITFGYLTDAQFSYCRDYVKGVLQRCRHEKASLEQRVACLRAKLRGLQQNLTTFRDYLAYVDRRRIRKMKADDAGRLVRCHAWDYTREWERCLDSAQAGVDSAQRFVASLNHFTAAALDQMRDHARKLESASQALDSAIESTASDLRILQRYVRVPHRLWNRVHRRWLRPGPTDT